MDVWKESLFYIFYVYGFLFSTSHRSEKSDISIGEEIDEISVETEESNASDKVCFSLNCSSLHSFDLGLTFCFFLP